MVAKKSLVASSLVIFDGHHIIYTIHDDIFSDIPFVFPVIFALYLCKPSVEYKTRMNTY